MVRRVKPIVCLVVLFAFVCALCLGGCASHQSLASTGSDSDPTVNVPKGAAPGPNPEPAAAASQGTGSLSFTLECPEWVAVEDESIVVHVVGTSAQGEAVDQQYTAQPDTQYLVAVEAGEYDVSLLTGAATKGHRLFNAPTQHVSFDGTEDQLVVLALSLDTDAMKSRQPSSGSGQKTMLPGAMAKS